MVFLGFELNSVSMTIKLVEKKVKKLHSKISEILGKKYCIRDIAELLGLMNSYSLAVPYGILHLKTIEIDKNKALLGVCF